MVCIFRCPLISFWVQRSFHGHNTEVSHHSNSFLFALILQFFSSLLELGHLSHCGFDVLK